MKMTGRVWKFGDGVCGDDGIIQFSRISDLAVYDEHALKAMCFQLIDPQFAPGVRAGDLIVAGHNFAHHSHPHVAVAIKASGIATVVVESCDSGFVRKALNIGLPVLICSGISGFVQPMEQLEIDLSLGEVVHAASRQSLSARAFSERMLGIVQAGGLIPFLKLQYSQGAVS